MDRITIASIRVIETNPPAHGVLPWKVLPTPLLLRTLKTDVSLFDNFLAYHGRDDKSYEIFIKLQCKGIATASCELQYKEPKGRSPITFRETSLNREGDGYYTATWLNVMIPGSGLCKVIALLRTEVGE